MEKIEKILEYMRSGRRWLCRIETDIDLEEYEEKIIEAVKGYDFRTVIDKNKFLFFCLNKERGEFVKDSINELLKNIGLKFEIIEYAFINCFEGKFSFRDMEIIKGSVSLNDGAVGAFKRRILEIAEDAQKPREQKIKEINKIIIETREKYRDYQPEEIFLELDEWIKKIPELC